MLRTKNIISSIYEVPVEWIFENYITLPAKLSGQDVKIKSVFNLKDKDPSMFIYHSRTANKYKFKDFSTGKQGDGIELVKELFSLPKRFDAALKIINDYNDFILSNGTFNVKEFKIHPKYELDSVQQRNWTESDGKYWSEYKINSKLLEHYNIQPLETFTLKKDGADKIVIRSTKIYGYFRTDGSIYKIYQPLMTDRKFFKVKNYIQGTDQLTYAVPYLVICSSLKDIMAFDKMKFKNAECIAPDSENVMLSKEVVEKLLKRYKKVVTLFDNDQAGITSMIKYNKEFGIRGAHLKLEKDLADCIKIHGIDNTREHLQPLLKRTLLK
jgi:hypothetical protein